MTSVDLLWASRTVVAGVSLVGADVVEVCPVNVGSLDTTALVAERVVCEIMIGITLRKGG